MRQSVIGNPCTECLIRMKCNKSRRDGSACREYLQFRSDEKKYQLLKRYGFKVLMSRVFGLGRTTIRGSLDCTDEQFAAWLQSLNEDKLESARVYLSQLLDQFYRCSRKKHPVIEALIERMQL
jgi:hypothetical protein